MIEAQRGVGADLVDIKRKEHQNKVKAKYHPELEERNEKDVPIRNQSGSA